MKKAIGNRYFSSTKQMAIQAMKGRAYVFMILGEYARALYDLDYAGDLVDTLFTTKIWTRKLFDRISLREIERADILTLKSWIYKTKGNMNKAMRCCKRCLQLINSTMMQLRQMIRNQSERINPKYKREILNRVNRTRVGIFNTMGAIYGDRGIYIKAISYFKKLFAISKKIRDVGGMGTACNNLGFIYIFLGNHRQAIKSLNKALVLTNIAGNRVIQGLAYNNLGYIYYTRCEYDKARIYYEKYLQISEEIGSQLGKALAINNLGALYLQAGSLEKAEAYLLEAELLFNRIGDRYTLTETYLFLAELQTKQKISFLSRRTRLRKALRYLEKAFFLAYELKSIYRIACCHLTAGRIYGWANEFGKTIKNYEKAIQLFKSINQKRELIDAYFEIGKVIDLLPVFKKRKTKLKKKQSWYFTRARILCRKLRLTQVLKRMTSSICVRSSKR